MTSKNTAEDNDTFVAEFIDEDFNIINKNLHALAAIRNCYEGNGSLLKNSNIDMYIEQQLKVLSDMTTSVYGQKVTAQKDDEKDSITTAEASTPKKRRGRPPKKKTEEEEATQEASEETVEEEVEEPVPNNVAPLPPPTLGSAPLPPPTQDS